MNKNLLIALSVLIAGSLIGLAFVLRPEPNQSVRPLGSVAVASEYNASSTKDHVGNTIADLDVLVEGQGTLGSVVITGANAGTFVLYDATSTMTNTEWATTTLATFPTNAATGTYTFDVIFQKGLLLDYVTGMATSTITWRAR
jgi:hypothetical protein